MSRPWYAVRRGDWWFVERHIDDPETTHYGRVLWVGGWSGEMLARNHAAKLNGEPLPFAPIPPSTVAHLVAGVLWSAIGFLREDPWGPHSSARWYARAQEDLARVWEGP